jgi:F-type H+-transporting ATPase subunit b
MLTPFNTIVLAATEGGGEEEGGSFLVTPGIGLMVWTLAIFVVVMLILKYAAFPQIAAALDKRQKLIEDSIDQAAATRQEADEVLEEYRERLKEARVQAEEIVARARKSGEEYQRDSTEKAKIQREELLAQTKSDVEAETRRAIQEIRNEVAALTILATEKVTRKTLTDADQKRLIDETLAELDFSGLSGASSN